MLYRVLIRVESLFCIAIEMDNKTPMSNAEEQENNQYSNSPEEYVEYDEREYERVADITVEIDKLVVRTPEEIVRQAQGELCLINLCGTQIPLPEDSFTRLLPDTYPCIHDEKLLYAGNYRRPFHAKCSDRRPLLSA